MNKIKTCLVFLFTIALSAFAAACSSNNDEAVTPEIVIPENILTNGLNFSKAGGTNTLSIKANVSLKVTSSQTWCTVTPVSSTSDTVFKYMVNVEPNTGKERMGTITFALGDLMKTVTVTQLAGETDEPGSNEIAGETPWAVSKSLGLGWNLGNQLDAYSNGVANETIWGNPKTTQALFDKLAAAGITTVRVPVTWMGHIGAAPGYEIEKAWLDRVAEVVGYAENAGLNAIVNIHHDGADSSYWLNIKEAAKNESKNTAIKAELKAVWMQIAERFKDKGNFLAFESMNEIHDGGWGWGENRTDGGKQYAVLNEWNQVFVDAVRAVGGENADRFLGVLGYCTNPELTISSFILPTDKVRNRLMVAVHFYDPYEYTLNATYSEWGHSGAVGKKVSGGDEDNVKNIFSKLKAAYVDKGIPVYIGEMGCVHRAVTREESFRKYYLEYVCKAAKEYGMAPVYWDNGGTGTGKEESGLFNHATGDYLNNAQEIVGVMIKAVFTEDASYTLQSVYDNAPQ